MEKDKYFITDKLEELDKQLQALDTGMMLIGVGMENFSDKAVAFDVANLVRIVITDIRAGLDEIGSAVLMKERMEA